MASKNRNGSQTSHKSSISFRRSEGSLADARHPLAAAAGSGLYVSEDALPDRVMRDKQRRDINYSEPVSNASILRPA
jgi:hypothetical protein